MSSFLAPLLGVALSVAGQAQVLNGSIVGVFRPSAEARPTSVAESAADGGDLSAAALFALGVPVNGSTQSGVAFNGGSFDASADGPLFPEDLFTFRNGVERRGTSSGSAALDLFLNVAGLAQPAHLATIDFSLEATANAGGKMVPDIFKVSYDQPAPLQIGDRWLQFSLVDLPKVTSLAENSGLALGNLTLAAIPEPATAAAAFGVLALGAVVLARRRNAAAVA